MQISVAGVADSENHATAVRNDTVTPFSTKTAQNDGDITLKILTAVKGANDSQKHILTKKAVTAPRGHKGRAIRTLKKPVNSNTDDMREPASRILIADLLAARAGVTTYCPVAMTEAKRIFGDERGLTYAESPFATLNCADDLVIETEWKKFRRPAFEAIKLSLKTRGFSMATTSRIPSSSAACGIENFAIGR